MNKSVTVRWLVYDHEITSPECRMYLQRMGNIKLSLKSNKKSKRKMECAETDGGDEGDCGNKTMKQRNYNFTR